MVGGECVKKDIYKITVTNWTKHNPKHKRNFKKTLLDNRFCEDAKIRSLPMTSRWLFLNLLGVCSDMCGDTVEVSSNTLRTMLECNLNIDGVLDQLQSLQLVKYTKNTFLLERKGRERKGSEGNSVKGITEKKPEEKVEIVSSKQQLDFQSPGEIEKAPGMKANEAIVHYCTLWKKRYGSNPTMTKQQIGQLMRMVKELHLPKVLKLLEAYLKMNDTWYIKKRHDLVVFAQNISAIGHFMDTGKTISNTTLNQLDRTEGFRSQLERIRSGEA